ncbi:chaperonin 10-like protein [Pavlovales sp. CCMP2436]|nr:chaperonin 10-like protein [Pavlovales sp. CCMP2436]|mmetsp:Transcript_31159/g.77939  ORF Transcript_31159/g.77939 Transcript_31159/m.77939 type:complete len:254 (+) Transcript_31159:26-787(+)
MLRAVLLVAAGTACSAFVAPASSASALQNVAHRRSARSAAVMETVATSAYSLDNMVLDGPLQPLKDQVLVKVDDVDKQTKGGLFLTGESTDKPSRGVVVAAGPGKPHPYTDVLVTNPVVGGDKVLFGQYMGTKVKYCLEDHVMISCDDVLAVIGADGSIKPVRDRVMLKPIAKPVETSSGLVLTKEAAKGVEVPNQGEVVAVGEGRFTAAGGLEPVKMVIGDKVMYTRYGGVELTYEGQKLVFVAASDCLAKY